jgi:hypothetical protein
VVVILLSFKPSWTHSQSSSSAFLSLPSEVSQPGLYSEKNLPLQKIADEAAEKTLIKWGIHKSLTKYRKKYKRVSPISPGLRQPVRNIECLAFDITGKTTYLKPFFLSLLHSFLFRLTPF